MSAKQTPRPTVDIWYKSSIGNIFEVVAFYEQDDAIEIQHLDGSLEELDEDAWEDLSPKAIAPPHESPATAEGYDGDDGNEADLHDMIDLDGSGSEWAGSLDDYE